MLITHQSAEIINSPFLWAPGTQAWRSVTLELSIPFTLIRHSQREGACWIGQTCLLWREEDILELFRAVALDQDRKITQVALILPSKAADQGVEWKLESVAEVRSKTCDAGKTTLFYLKSNGSPIDIGRPKKIPPIATVLEYTSTPDSPAQGSTLDVLSAESSRK